MPDARMWPRGGSSCASYVCTVDERSRDGCFCWYIVVINSSHVAASTCGNQMLSHSLTHARKSRSINASQADLSIRAQALLIPERSGRAVETQNAGLDDCACHAGELREGLRAGAVSDKVPERLTCLSAPKWQCRRQDDSGRDARYVLCMYACVRFKSQVTRGRQSIRGGAGAKDHGAHWCGRKRIYRNTRADRTRRDSASVHNTCQKIIHNARR